MINFKSINYIGSPDFVIVLNHSRFNPLEFNEDSIVKESIIHNQQFDSTRPTFINSHLMIKHLEDATNFLQFGNDAESDFVDLSSGR